MTRSNLIHGTSLVFPSNRLQYALHEWYSFICSDIMPTTHTSTINIEKAALLYAILQGKVIDFSKIINRVIRKVVTDKSRQ